jgi:hypothetical protein
LTHSTATYKEESNETTSIHHHLPTGRRPATPPGTAPAEEKLPPQYFSILQRSDRREAGAIGGIEVKTITIRLPDVEAAMLLEVQKVNKACKDLQSLLLNQIQQEYQKVSSGRTLR